jgi:hypothetical protein
MQIVQEVKQPDPFLSAIPQVVLDVVLAGTPHNPVQLVNTGFLEMAATELWERVFTDGSSNGMSYVERDLGVIERNAIALTYKNLQTVVGWDLFPEDGSTSELVEPVNSGLVLVADLELDLSEDTGSIPEQVAKHLAKPSTMQRVIVNYDGQPMTAATIQVPKAALFPLAVAFGTAFAVGTTPDPMAV